LRVSGFLLIYQLRSYADLPERLMMMVSSSSVFVNRFRPQCSRQDS